MSTSAPTSPPAHPDHLTVLGRALAAEWTRLWTLRSTWWILLAVAALMLFIGAAMGSDHDGGEPAPIWVAAQIAIVPGQFAFLLVVLLAVTGEYSTGAIRSSLQWVPRRGVLLAARTLVPVAAVTAAAVLLSLAADLVAWAFLDTAEVVPADIAGSLGRIALTIAFGSVLSVGLGLLLRSTAGALTGIFLLMFALVVTLGNSGVRWLVTIADHLPGHAVISLLMPEETLLPSSTIAMVLLGWGSAALLAGGWSLLRRDAV